MKRANKVLSLILTLCMIASLFAGLTVSAGAVASNTQISILSDGATGPDGGGWNWDATTKTLTLSGVDIETSNDTEPIFIGDGIGSVTLVIEGANRLVNSSTTLNGASLNALRSNAALTIKGSGTLETESAAGSGMSVKGLLTIESGYITAQGGARGITVSAGGMTVTGGYVEATGTGDSAGHGIYLMSTLTYTQSGGYVKTTSTNDSGLKAPTVKVSGGYLEASGKKGIACTDFYNEGGVVKATGSAPDVTSYAIMAGVSTLYFNGGVTIASATGGSDTMALYGNCRGGDGEKIYDATNLSAATTALSNNNATSELTSVIVAKAAYNSQQTLTSLDGVYIKTSSGTAWKPSDAATIPANTGSYVESGNSTAVGISGQEKDLTVNGTLVCSGLWGGIISKSLTVADGGTVFANGDVGAAITNTGTDTYKIDCSGTVIGVGNGNGGIVANGGEMSVTGGYACGIDLGSDGYGIQATKLTATGGCITGVALTHGVRIGAYAITSFVPSTTSTDISVTGTAALTATGTAAYYGPEVTAPGGKVVFGSANPGVLASATYDSANKNYGSAVVFFFKESTGPSMTVGDQSAAITAGSITSSGVWTNYTLAANGFTNAISGGYATVNWFESNGTTPASQPSCVDTVAKGAVTGSVGSQQFDVQLRVTSTATAGTYYFKVTYTQDGKTLTSALKTLTISPAAGAGAAVSGTAITGYTGEEVSKDVTVTLTELKFKTISDETDVAAWFNLPTDWTAKIKGVVADGATTATVTIAAAADKVTAAATGSITGKADGIAKNTYIKDAAEGTLTLTGSVSYTITKAPDSWVGTDLFNYSDATAGSAAKGWTWNGTTKTLTLSGVNVSRSGKQGIFIAGDATIVLEGANKATANTNKKAALDCSGSLTIKGSGTLEASSTNGNGVNIGKTLTVKSGYITVSGGVCGISTDGAVTVDGGYIVASATGNGSGISIAHASFEMNGGYVKTSGAKVNTSGLYARTNVTIKGGYIEATGVVGGIETYNGIFTNGGGVVKATGTTNGIKVTTARFTGGVTIATGSTKAIYGATVTGTEDRLEKVWTLTDGVASTETEIGTSITGTSVVIAKAIAAPAADANGLITLDGVYLYSAADDALNTLHDTNQYYDIAATGGSYLETGAYTKSALLADNVSVTGTLVCECKDTTYDNSAECTLGAQTIDVKSSATLYCFAGSKFALMAEGASAEISNAGNLIGDALGAGIVASGELNVTSGYVCGNGRHESDSMGVMAVSALTASDGYITGVGSYGVWIETSADVTGKAVITAVGTTTAAHSGAEIVSGTEKAAVTGATAVNTPLAATTYDDTDKIYKVDHNIAKVLLIKGKSVTPPPPPNPGTPAATNNDAIVIVDGVEYDIGTKTVSGGTTAIKVDQTALDKQIDKATTNVTVPISAETDTVKAELVVKNLDNMEAKNMTLTIQTDDVSYEMRASAVDTDAIMKQLGATDAEKVPLTITIKKSDSATQAAAEKAIEKVGAEVVVKPVEFTVTASYGGKSIDVSEFDRYVQRLIEITKEQFARATTGVVFEADGTVRHVPTNVLIKDSHYFATVNSLTNSTYAIIYNEQSFADAKGAWYEKVVNEMASRKVIAGRDSGDFDGNSNITRAEFAAIAVRALGLPADGTSSFTDVKADAWYAGAVGTAVEYGLVSGRTASTYDPEAYITRQEAMQLIANAAKVAEYTGKSGALTGFKDASGVAAWAQAAAQFNVGSGLIVGSNGNLNPTANITRAETATVVLRLLQNAGLVDIRTKA